MAYTFQGKTAREITDGYVARINESMLEILVVFKNLDELPPNIRSQVLDNLEDRIVEQAVQIGNAWVNGCADGSKVRKTALTLEFISSKKGDVAKPFTRLFDKEHKEMPGQASVEGIASCFSRVTGKIAHNAALMKQQKLNKHPATGRLRIGGMKTRQEL